MEAGGSAAASRAPALEAAPGHVSWIRTRPLVRKRRPASHLRAGSARSEDTPVQIPETRYATTEDGVHIAYQVAGTGSLDVLLVDTWVHHVEAVWDFPDFARFLRRLASFGRLIHFDRRGTGLSDPVPLDRLPDLEKQMEDAVAVLDEVGSTQAAVLGLNDGTLVAMLLASAHPGRCRSLVLFTPTAAHTHAGGMPMEEIDAVIQQIAARVPVVVPDPPAVLLEQASRQGRHGAVEWPGRRADRRHHRRSRPAAA